MSVQAGAFVSDGTKMVRVTSFGQALATVIAEGKSTYHDISNNVGATKADIKKWEAGEDHPTPVQLSKLFKTFPRLKHLAATFQVPGAEALPVLPVSDGAPTKPLAAELAYVGGEMGDLEVAAIEYARAIRDHVKAVTRAAELRKAMNEADAEAKRLDELVNSLFGKLQQRAGE